MMHLLIKSLLLHLEGSGRRIRVKGRVPISMLRRLEILDSRLHYLRLIALPLAEYLRHLVVLRLIQEIGRDTSVLIR
jgi:hypothetical protein